MNTHIKIVAGCLLALGIASAAQAADSLLLTGEKVGGGTALGLDLSSSGQGTALEFRISVGDSAKVDLTGCLKNLPSTHAGQCAFAKGSVIGLVYSDSNALLPAGMLSLGSIGVTSKSKPSLALFLVSDVQGNKLSSSVKNASDVVESKNAAK